MNRDTAYRQFERKDSKYTCPAFKGTFLFPTLPVPPSSQPDPLFLERNRPNHLSLVRPPPPAHRAGLFATLHRLHGALSVLRPREKAGGRRNQPRRADEHGPPYTWVRSHMASSFFFTAEKDRELIETRGTCGGTGMRWRFLSCSGEKAMGRTGDCQVALSVFTGERMSLLFQSCHFIQQLVSLTPLLLSLSLSLNRQLGRPGPVHVG